MNLTDIKKLPKTELHLHLDCSISFEAAQNLEPGISLQQYQVKYIAPEKCINLADFLSCTMSGINVMQTEQQLKIVVRDLFKQLKEDNIILAEIRFAPLLHSTKGLFAEDVVEIVTEEFRKCSSEYNIKTGIILCTLRHFNKAESMKTVKLVEKYIKNTNVCGFDIAADEAGYSIDSHKEAFLYAIRKDIPRTSHAGEAKGPESIWETLYNFQTKRIGHGVRSAEDPELIAYLLKNNIHLEVCPTCNIQTNIYDSYADHPIDYLFNQGIVVGINTDARTLSNISLSEEYFKLSEAFNWTTDHFRKCNINAINNAFISEREKADLKIIINNYYK